MGDGPGLGRWVALTKLCRPTLPGPPFASGPAAELGLMPTLTCPSGILSQGERASTDRPASCCWAGLCAAILSFLFNWPSTGGGNHHTAELAAFLARAGYRGEALLRPVSGLGHRANHRCIDQPERGDRV